MNKGINAILQIWDKNSCYRGNGINRTHPEWHEYEGCEIVTRNCNTTKLFPLLNEEADENELKELGIAIWIPPWNGDGPMRNGYVSRGWYETHEKSDGERINTLLHNDSYGTLDDHFKFVRKFQGEGILLIGDIPLVVRRCEDWAKCIVRKPEMEIECFHSNSKVFRKSKFFKEMRRKNKDVTLGSKPKRKALVSNYSPNLDHSVPRVRECSEEYMSQLQNNGVRGIRLDSAVKLGNDSSSIWRNYLKIIQPEFCVSELFLHKEGDVIPEGIPNSNRKWIENTMSKEYPDGSSIFYLKRDFVMENIKGKPLKPKKKDSIAERKKKEIFGWGKLGELFRGKKYRPGLMGSRTQIRVPGNEYVTVPLCSKVVTYIQTHDTQNWVYLKKHQHHGGKYFEEVPKYGRFPIGWNLDELTGGYAFICLQSGIPCISGKHYYWFLNEKEEDQMLVKNHLSGRIKKFLRTRKEYGITESSIVEEFCPRNGKVYISKIEGKGDEKQEYCVFLGIWNEEDKEMGLSPFDLGFGKELGNLVEKYEFGVVRVWVFRKKKEGKKERRRRKEEEEEEEGKKKKKR